MMDGDDSVQGFFVSKNLSRASSWHADLHHQLPHSGTILQAKARIVARCLSGARLELVGDLSTSVPRAADLRQHCLGRLLLMRAVQPAPGSISPSQATFQSAYRLLLRLFQTEGQESCGTVPDALAFFLGGSVGLAKPGSGQCVAPGQLLEIAAYFFQVLRDTSR